MVPETGHDKLAMTTMIQPGTSAPASIATFPDHAHVRVVVSQPQLDPTAATALTTALGKLFTQFVREDRMQEWTIETIDDGIAILCAWTGGPISGCSHDKLHGVLEHAERNGHSLLAPPPIAVKANDGWRCGTRADLRAWVAAGEVSGASLYLDRTVATLGEWRLRGIVTLEGSGLPLVRKSGGPEVR